MEDKTEGTARVIEYLLDVLRRLEVTECCVAAGARNASIIAALHEAPGFEPLRHFFDERSAGFFALGRAMATRRAVAVVTTSGTAAAELLPAMVEAWYQQVTLVAVTADRPSRYAGSGAPQAIEQRGLFGRYAKREVEIEWLPGQGLIAMESWIDENIAEPVHINVRLEEGLAPVVRSIDEEKPLPLKIPDADGILDSHYRNEWEEFWNASGNVVVLAAGIHPEDADHIAATLLKWNLPIVAEATSQLGSDERLRHLLLRGGEQALKAGKFGSVVRIGCVPSWRWWRDLEDRPEVSVVNISRAPFRGLARQRAVVTLPWYALDWELPFVPVHDLSPSDGSIAKKLLSLLDQYPNSEPAWMRRLSQRIGAEASVFLGNSLPIREWNLAAEAPKANTHFFANRGANGIDGIISTWLGVSANSRESWCIVGDLTAMYDLSAPWIIPQLPDGKRRLIVINNGGGKIFSRVGWLSELPEPVREIVENRHDLRFQSWAAMWGLGYRVLTKAEDSSHNSDDASCELWEVRPDAAETEGFWSGWRG